MSTRKRFYDGTNWMWARVSFQGEDADPADVIMARSGLANEGHEPLVDEYGRQYVRVSSSLGNVPVTTGFYQTTVLATSGDIKTTPGVLLQVWGFNPNATTKVYFMLFDETGPPPANGTTPLITLPVQPNDGLFSLTLHQPDYGNPVLPVPFDTNGIEWAVSTTIPTLTLAAVPIWVNAVYI